MEGRNTGNKNVDVAEDDEVTSVDEDNLVGEDVDLLGCGIISLVTICMNHLSLDMFLYAKRTGGHPISAHIKHCTVALIRTEM